MTKDYEDFKQKVTNRVIKSRLSNVKTTNYVDKVSITNGLLADMIECLLKLGSMVDGYFNTQNPEDILAQQKLVPTAGTAVQLPALMVPAGFEVTVKALTTNTDAIYVGSNQLDAQDHSKGFPLLASEALELKVDNLDRLWIDAVVSGEGIAWVVEQRRKNEPGIDTDRQ